MSKEQDNDNGLDDQWSRGLRCLRRGKYWHAHEALEEVWLSLPDPSASRRATKALIQLAAICYKAEQAADGRSSTDMQRGMGKLLQTASEHLETSHKLDAPAPTWSRDVLVAALGELTQVRRDWLGGAELSDVRDRISEIATEVSSLFDTEDVPDRNGHR